LLYTEFVILCNRFTHHAIGPTIACALTSRTPTRCRPEGCTGGLRVKRGVMPILARIAHQARFVMGDVLMANADEVDPQRTAIGRDLRGSRGSCAILHHRDGVMGSLLRPLFMGREAQASLSRRELLRQTTEQAAMLVRVLPFATARCNAQPKKVYNSAFLNALFDPEQPVQDAVKLRYRCQVTDNQCVTPEMWKIIFMYRFLSRDATAKKYELQSNLYSWRFIYPHPSRRASNGEVKYLRNNAGESRLF